MFRLPVITFAPDDALAAAAPVAPATPAATPGPAEGAAIAAAPAADAAPAAPVESTSAAPAASPAPAANDFLPTAMEAGKPAAEPAPAATEAPPPDGKPANAAAAKPDVKPGDPPEATKDAAPATTDAPADQAQAPPSYAFTFPDDIKADQVNPERMSALTSLLGEAKVQPEVAQKLLDMHIAEMRDLSSAVETRLSSHQWDVFRTQQNQWLDEIKADPTLGGSRFQTAMRTCATVIEQYGGTPEEQTALWNDLRATGMGNSPRFARLFHRLGTMFGREGGMIPASQPKAPTLSRQQRGEQRYAGTTR